MDDILISHPDFSELVTIFDLGLGPSVSPEEVQKTFPFQHAMYFYCTPSKAKHLQGLSQNLVTKER